MGKNQLLYRETLESLAIVFQIDGPTHNTGHGMSHIEKNDKMQMPKQLLQNALQNKWETL